MSLSIAPEDAAEEVLRRRHARKSLLEFVRYVWWEAEEFKIGLHTRIICDRIDKAIEDYEAGKSTFLAVKVPFRHGKSQIISRALPAYFVARAAASNPDIISTGYGADLVHKFSWRARNIVASKRFQCLFPDVRPNQSKSTNALWKVDYRKGEEWVASAGEVTATGLGGALTGSGYHLGLVDDYCKSRADAESETYRNATWESITNDFMTRRAPVSITIITATPWNPDDVFGRLAKAMHDNPLFPRFEWLTFPARGEASVNGERMAYQTKYLFPERFEDDWYQEQYATLGNYASAGLLDCEPTVRAGNMFHVDNVKIHDSIDEFPKVRYVRHWDLASTEKQRASDNPDYTAGAKVGITREKGRNQLWIPDIVAGQWEAPQRNRRIIDTTQADGPSVPVIIEQVAGYKDTVTTLKDILRGVRSVQGVNVSGSGDKVVRAAPMEPIFEAGEVHILRAAWNDLFLKHFREFPKGRHDDVVDAVGGGYNYLAKGLGSIGTVDRAGLGF